MDIGSNCSDTCENCRTHFIGGCLAGHGDDCFTQITEENAKEIIEKKWYRSEFALKELLKRFPNIINCKVVNI